MKRRDLFEVVKDITFPKEIIYSGYPGLSNEQPELVVKKVGSKKVGIVFQFDSNPKNQTVEVHLAENGEGVFKRLITLQTFARLYAEGKLDLVTRGNSSSEISNFPLFQHHQNTGFGGPIS